MTEQRKQKEASAIGASNNPTLCSTHTIIAGKGIVALHDTQYTIHLSDWLIEEIEPGKHTKIVLLVRPPHETKSEIFRVTPIDTSWNHAEELVMDIGR